AGGEGSMASPAIPPLPPQALSKDAGRGERHPTGETVSHRTLRQQKRAPRGARLSELPEPRKVRLEKSAQCPPEIALSAACAFTRPKPLSKSKPLEFGMASVAFGSRVSSDRSRMSSAVARSTL